MEFDEEDNNTGASEFSGVDSAGDSDAVIDEIEKYTNM